MKPRDLGGASRSRAVVLGSGRFRGAIAGTVLASMTLAGCGGSPGADSAPRAKPIDFAEQPGTTIVGAAIADTRNAKVMRIRGTVTEDGGPLTIDVRIDPLGNCAGTMSAGKGTAQVVVTRSAAYIKGDDAFWKDAGGSDAAALVKVLNGRWLKSKPDPRISGLCKIGAGMITRLTKDLPTRGGSVHVGGHSTIDGADVVELNDGPGSSLGSIFVSTEAPHYIRRLVANDADTKGTLTLSDFDNRDPIEIPSPGESFEPG